MRIPAKFHTNGSKCISISVLKWKCCQVAKENTYRSYKAYQKTSKNSDDVFMEIKQQL